MPGKKVLIVEDRRENIVFLANNVLRPGGYEVITAMDGEQGLKRAMADRPDLIIMDLNMPKRDGLEVMAALREQHLFIPVILTTFYGSEQVAQQAYRLGASGYVVKPYTVSEMEAAVDKALESHGEPQKPAEAPEAIPLTRQLERWMRDMNILNNIGKALVAQLDLDSVLARAVEAAAYISRAEQGFLFLVSEDGQTRLMLRATRGPAERQMRVLDRAVDSPLAAQTLRAAKVLVRNDAREERMLAEIAGQALGPLIAAPLRWRRQPIGVLVAARHPGDPIFRDTDAEWLIGLADYVAIAVSNARQFQQLAAAAPPPVPPGGPAGPEARGEMEQLAAELEAAAQRIRRLASM
jgi:CheY-like chemotaxis protein